MACLKPSKKEENQLLLMLILQTTSEVRHLLAVNGGLEEQQRGYDDMSEDDTFILDSAQNVLTVPELAWAYHWTTSRNDNMHIALRCLDAVRDMARHQSQTAAIRDLMHDVTKKTGAIWNELGKMAMAQAENLLVKNGATFRDLENTWRTSMERFERGLQSFRKVKDGRNEAIVMLNIIRLHRIAFHAYMNVTEGEEEVSKLIRRHFEEACECFKCALQRLGHSQPTLRNNTLWDYSSIYLHFGLYLQHNPSPKMDKHKVLMEVGEMYRKAMKTCQKIEVKVGDPLWVSCKDRQASLEYNMAEMQVVSYCLQTTAVRVNKVFAQADSSYKRAVDMFLQAKKYYKLLQVQCKRLAFYYRHGTDQDAPEMYGEVIRMFVDCQQSMQEIQASGDPSRWEKLEGDAENPLTMLEYLLKPVLSTFQLLLKRATQNKKTEAQQQLKDVYRRSLELQNQVKDDRFTLQHKFKTMAEFITYLQHHMGHDAWTPTLLT